MSGRTKSKRRSQAKGRKSPARYSQSRSTTSRQRTRKKRRSSTRKVGAGRAFYWSAVVAIWAGLMVLVAGISLSLIFPKPQTQNTVRLSPSVKIVDAAGSVISHSGYDGRYIKLADLPTHLTDAVLAIEDRRFRYHFGVDPIGLARAFYINYRSSRRLQGGSTITQQLAKNLYLKPERTILRKSVEMVLAVWLEWQLTKVEILELYLNSVYFGSGSYGIEAAAQRYFSKSASRLSLQESAMLAGLLKAPSKFSPLRNLSGARKRANIVVTAMHEAGKLSRVQSLSAKRNPARVRPGRSKKKGSYPVDWVLEVLPGYVGNTDQQLIVYTTIDNQLQKYAERVVNRRMKNVGQTDIQAAAVILDTTGGIKALVGGKSYGKSQFNRAVKAYRQPGSVFKPFVYLAAVELGMTPDTIVEDSPINVNGWSPKNYTRSFKGVVTLRDGLAKSVNTATVRLLLDVGRDRVVQTARRLGIRSKLHNSPSIALGTGEVSLLEITSSYVPFANGGYGVVPHIIERVTTSRGKVLYQRQGQGPGRVVLQKHISAMNDMMQETIHSGTGKVARLSNHRAAGKTGTTQDSRDAWFVGYTAYYTAGIWIGKDDATQMQNVTGGGLPAVIWQNLMQGVHDRLTPRPLPGTRYTSLSQFPYLRQR
ncbi:MAG: transglycosylase domain-containing protein [Methyloligellaceae bacterium]